MARPNKKFQDYVNLNEQIKYLTKLKEKLRYELVVNADATFPIDIVGITHQGTIQLKGREHFNVSALKERYPHDYANYKNKGIIKKIIFNSIIYKEKVRKVA